MRKKIKRVFVLVTAAGIVACLPQVSVEAGSHTFNKKLLASLSKCTYQYSADYSKKYGNKTDSGVKLWNDGYEKYGTFTMNWTRTYGATYTAAFVATKISDVGGTPPYADTTWFSDYNGKIDPDVYNWTHAVVRINSEYNTVPESTIAHEIGHLLGLKHRNDKPDSIMCQDRSGRTATKPSDIDKALVGLKYVNNK